MQCSYNLKQMEFEKTIIIPLAEYEEMKSEIKELKIQVNKKTIIKKIVPLECYIAMIAIVLFILFHMINN